MNLTENQLRAVNEIDHNLQIIACAGSGKTEVISRRIAKILNDKTDIAPENVVCFTFTNKAADSMKHRIETAVKAGDESEPDIGGMYIGTIHSFCMYLLQNYTDRFRDIRILDNVKTFHFISRYNKAIGMDEWGLSANTFSVRLFSDCISKLADDYLNRDTWEDKDRKVFDSYRRCLYDHGFIDFTFLILETLLAIDTDPGLREYLSGIKYLTVDEYQDIDDLQEQMIRKIVNFGANICVVGDDDQTIYQFRGSNADHMINFADHYRDVVQVRLDTNFRCSPGIVDVAETVIRKNGRRIDKHMASGRQGIRSEIAAERYQSEEDEWERIADRIETLHSSGISYNEIAVLFRKGKRIGALGKELELRGIPYIADSASSFFSGRYFQCFLQTLQILTDPDKAKFVECWEGIISGEYISSGFRYIRRQQSGGRWLHSIFSDFIDTIHFLDEGYDDIAVREDDADGFLRILDDYEDIFGDRQLSAKIDGIIDFVNRNAVEEYKYHSFRTPSAPEAVNIMTVHKAKGLEFDTVFIPELQEGEFPPGNMGGKKYWHVLGGSFKENKEKYETSVDDERKLFYVAATRAKRNLFLSYQLTKKGLSRFVKEAADSSYLTVDREDFKVTVPSGNSCRRDTWPDYDLNYSMSGSQWERGTGMSVRNGNDYLQEMEYRKQVKAARDKVLDYYGTAAHSFRGAMGDYMSARSMSDDQILEEAKRLHII